MEDAVESDQTDASLLTDPDELLWRNVHPAWADGNKLTSQAFAPMPKDQHKLSTARSSKVSAEKHYAEFTCMGYDSAGVWAVTVGEAKARALTVVDDESELVALGLPAPTGHTSVDFGSLPSNSARKRVAALLRDDAEVRGRQHPSDA